MSWKDKIENGIFKITTGDGKVWKPLWKAGESTVDFNTASYNFINLEGTLVDRKKVQSRKYPLSVWFQGEDNIEITESFLQSAKDSRAWEVEHPLYGIINGQPLSISRNDVNLNATELKIEFWESISVDYPEDEVSVRDRIKAKAIVVRSAGIKSYSAAKPATPNIVTMKGAVTQTKGPFLKMAIDKKVEYQNAINTALKAADKLVSNQANAIEKQQAIFSIPATFETTVNRKIQGYKKAIIELLDFITGKNDKYFYESQAATALSAACECSVNPLGKDYTTRAEIEAVAVAISEMYAGYLQVLDENQVSRYDVDNTWYPDANLQSELNDLVVDTISNLQILAFQAKQERRIYTEKDTNLILLTHRYIGLDANDENMENFRQINNIKNDEVFLVRKGREIKYYA